MKRDLRLYIKDILEQMEKAEAFIDDMDYNAFFADEKTCYAVQRCLEIIGEAAKQGGNLRPGLKSWAGIGSITSGPGA